MKEYQTLHPHFLHGADYNPDQWLAYPEVLAQDPEMMAQAHCNCMSVGIFSWAMLEPKEGEYHFEELDYFIKNLASKGVKTILATPSAARPRWLAEKYPEVRRVNKSGVREQYNTRHNYCYTSPVYREKVAAIDRLLAQLPIKSYDLPEGVSIHAREDYLFIENYNDHPVTVNLPGSYRNMETEQLYNDTVCVEPYNIVIVCSQQ